MLAAHLGVVDEQQINNMSWVFFDDVLTELGYKLHYDAIAHFAGNSFCKDAWGIIEKSNPFNLSEDSGKTMGNLASFLAGSKITIMGGNNDVR